MNIFHEMVACRMMDLEAINTMYRIRKEKKNKKREHKID